ncbi:ATP-binding protein [Ruegeria jejuensis]|uniref:ATP-binding protein n=1 Tax=Ruegeria jejuensis TaxID=3233338 RepID=UPI00355C9925
MNVAPRTAAPSATADLPIEEAILSLVRTLCRRRILWLDSLAEQAVAEPDLRNAQARALADMDAPEQEVDFLDSHGEAKVLWEEAGALHVHIFEGENRLRHVADVFGLSIEERQLVLLCLAAAIDPSLHLVFQSLSGLPGGPVREDMAARLFGHGRNAMWGPGSPLCRWHILEEVGGTLRLDPYVQSYLRGASDVDPDVATLCRVFNEAPDPLPNWPVGDLSARLIDALQRGMPTRVIVLGQPLSGRTTFAALISARLGRSVSVIDTSRIAEQDWDQVRMRVQRQALLHNSTVAWAGANALKGIEPLPDSIDVEFLILETQEDATPAIGWHEERVKIPSLSSSERKALWQRYLPGAQVWPDGALDQLADRFRVTIGEIRHVAAQGDNSFEGVRQRTRALSHGKLGDLARLVDCPFERSDLHLPDGVSDHLDEFLYEAKTRNAFWEDPGARRLFPRGVGLIGLMSGPPGTGKTMAAQVIARELGLDLFRIDVATMIDKYIGETAKRLKRLFARASEINAVLLFDEADALFARRTDTKDSLDKHSNADTSYLLQLVEDYPGVALLATNKRQQIDDAFVRRIRYVFYLPRPERAERLAIWQQVVSVLASPQLAADLSSDLERLSSDLPMTGAQIKNAALAAVFFSRRDGTALTAAHLTRAVDQQMINQGGGIGTKNTRAGR